MSACAGLQRKCAVAVFQQPEVFLCSTLCIILQPSHAGVSCSACETNCGVFQHQHRLLALRQMPKPVQPHRNSIVQVVKQVKTWAPVAHLSARVCMLSDDGLLWQTAGKDLLMFGMMLASSDGIGSSGLGAA